MHVGFPLPVDLPDDDSPTTDFAWLEGDQALAVPMLPEVAHRVIDLTSSPDVPLPTLSNLVAKDQVLAARVLGLANSAYSSPLQPITTVTDAVVRLGAAAVRNVVITVCFSSRMHDPAVYGTQGRDMVDHAIGTAYLARLVAEHARASRDEAFLYGLLHDIGKLVILKTAHDYEKQHRTRLAPEIVDLALVERHASMGALAMRRWKLPASLDEPVLFHHNYQAAPPHRRTEAAVACAANLLAHRYGFGCRKSDADVLSDPVAAELGLDGAWLVETDTRAPGLFSVAKQILG